MTLASQRLNRAQFAPKHWRLHGRTEGMTSFLIQNNESNEAPSLSEMQSIGLHGRGSASLQHMARLQDSRALSIALSAGIAALIKAMPTLAGEGGGSTAGTIAL